MKNFIKRRLFSLVLICSFLCTIGSFSLTAFAVEDLATLISSASPGSTITLSAGTYSGETLNIQKNITIEAATSQEVIFDYDSIQTNSYAVTIKGLTIHAKVQAGGAITIKNCILTEGLELTDGMAVNAKVSGSTFHYNSDTTEEAVKVLGSGSAPAGSYQFCQSSEPANTFINFQKKDSPVAIWPFTDSSKKLDLYKSYWKFYDNRDMKVDDIVVSGHVQPYTCGVISFDSYAFTEYPFETPSNFKFVKTSTPPNSPLGIYKSYPNSIQHGDSALFLYDKTPEESGSILPKFEYANFDKEFDPINDVPVTPLHKTYRLKYKFGYLKDVGGHSLYTDAEISSIKFYGSQSLYLAWGDPEMPLFVQPRNMISYQGGSSPQNSFPALVYNYYADNMDYDPNDSTNKPEYIQFTQLWFDPSTIFSPKYLSAGVSATEKHAGPYSLEGKSSSDVIAVNQFADNSLWRAPKVFTFFLSNPFQNFYFSDPWQGSLYVRAASNHTSTEPVEETLPHPSPVNPMALIPDPVTVNRAAALPSTQYENSAEVALVRGAVSLFNDYEEPNVSAYNTLLNRVKAIPELSNRSYQYHHLVLVDADDGNHLVTTPAQKTIYIPYPASYKAGDFLSVARFQDYQRMPSDNPSAGSMAVIAENALTKLAEGFTFQTDSLGSFFVIYGETTQGGGGNSGGGGDSGGGGGSQATSFTITASSEGTGTISPNGVTAVPKGEGQTYLIVPGNGYHIADIIVDGVSVPINTSYTFTDVIKNHSIHVVFSKSPGGAVDLNKTDHFAYIIGYPEGDVRPQDQITRAEVSTIFFRLLTDEARAKVWSNNNSFKDITLDQWHNIAISTLANKGILQGYGSYFSPNNFITRAEFATIAARFDLGDYQGLNKFDDIKGHWAAKDINKAAENGWIDGYSDGNFRPDQYITRAEAMTLLNRVLERSKVSPEHMLQEMIHWPDNPTTAWFYAEVQEATNAHEYRKETGVETWTKLIQNRDWKSLEQPKV